MPASSAEAHLLPLPATILALPLETLIDIAHFLPIVSLFRLASTSSKLRQIILSPTTWKRSRFDFSEAGFGFRDWGFENFFATTGELISSGLGDEIDGCSWIRNQVHELVLDMSGVGPPTLDFVYHQMPNVTYISAKFCVLLDERALRRYISSLIEELDKLQALQLIFEVPLFARPQRSLTLNVDGALDEYSDVTKVVRENAKLLLPGLEIRPALCSSCRRHGAAQDEELNPNQIEECTSNPYAAQRCLRCLHSATCRDCGTFYPEARCGNGFAPLLVRDDCDWCCDDNREMYGWCSDCIPEWVKCTDRNCLKEMCGVCSEDSCCSCGEGPFCQAHLLDDNGDFSHWKTCRAGVDRAG